jgi:hypothetical protein
MNAIEIRRLTPNEATASNGASARVEGVGADETIVVRDGEGRLVFEYSAALGRTTLHLAAGDLDVVVPGTLRVRAGKGVALEAPELAAVAARARLVVDEGSVVARALSTAADRWVVTAGSLETQAEQIVERARDVFRDAEGLVQQTAGRMRSLVRGTLQMVSRRAVVKADEDLKLDGERIHLG